MCARMCVCTSLYLRLRTNTFVRVFVPVYVRVFAHVRIYAGVRDCESVSKRVKA